AALLAGSDIDDAAFNEPGSEVTLFSFVSVSENLCRVVGEEWPLDAMAVWSSAMQGALEVATRSAATVGQGVDILARFGHVRGPFLALRTKRDKTKTSLILTCTVSMSKAAQRATSETAVLSAKSMLDQILEGFTAGIEYHFPWATPNYAERMCAVLAGTVKFNQPHCAIVLPNALCDRPSPFADAALLSTATAELEHAADRIHGNDTLQVRVERLLKRRRTGRLSEEEAAKELGLSRRTLVRRLSANGTTYRKILDANLRMRAQHLLTQRKLSRPEMAEALGFQDPTSFSRACRRWFKTEQ
ncbi:MAG: AraC family transcriptional regulator, partial [Alphaproteobacteria bacterium]|nr:AraC family transcriptional regulator [Alphaproteobacteria bacterium]